MLSDEGVFTTSVDWIVIGSFAITWGILLDSLSVIMIGFVTFVSLLVQLYSLGYMLNDPRISWFFSVISLFTAAMLVLVLSDNLIFLYFAWEIVGLGSYLLIGFYYDREAASQAAKKAFITTRIGDVGLLIGILLIYKSTGTFNISSIIDMAQNGAISESVLTSSSLLIFFGAMGKSAQFPLHVWLPDAMEGPTPASALIHAATMVAAGVYLVARMHAFFDLAPVALPIVFCVGLVTFLIGGSLAIVMTDLKRALAYSTMSHLGLMMLSLGAGTWVVAILHLVVHGLSKSLLFLCAGSVMHGTGDQTDCWSMGGLKKNMKITAYGFTIGALSLGGINPLAGFFSKEEILVSLTEYGGLWPIILIVVLAGVFISTFYITRLTVITFYGEARSDHAEKAHESSWIMTTPLVILSALVVMFGFILVPLPFVENYKGLGHFIDPQYKFHFVPWLSFLSIIVASSGLLVGWLFYGSNVISHKKMTARISPFYDFVVRKYKIDDLYQWVIDHAVLAFARLVSFFDRVVLNDALVNGTGKSVLLSSFRIKYLQTGRSYNYAMAMVIGVILSLAVWWLA